MTAKCNIVWVLLGLQPEPGGMTTRPGSVFGYGGTLPHLSAPVPMPRLSLRPASVHGNRAADSSCSEEEDRTDLLGRNFHVPRPKSRSSVAVSSTCYWLPEASRCLILYDCIALVLRTNFCCERKCDMQFTI